MKKNFAGYKNNFMFKNAFIFLTFKQPLVFYIVEKCNLSYFLFVMPRFNLK